MRREQGYHLWKFQLGRLNFDYGFGEKTAEFRPTAHVCFLCFCYFLYRRRVGDGRQVGSFVEKTFLYRLRCRAARTAMRNGRKLKNKIGKQKVAFRRPVRIANLGISYRYTGTSWYSSFLTHFSRAIRWNHQIWILKISNACYAYIGWSSRGAALNRAPLFFHDFQISRKSSSIRLTFLPQIEHRKSRNMFSSKNFVRTFFMVIYQKIGFRGALPRHGTK